MCDKTNNTIGNLEWVTPKENSRHRIVHGTQARRENHGRAKLTQSDVAAIRRDWKPYNLKFSKPALARKYGVCRDTIKLILNNEIWRSTTDGQS